MHCVCDCIRGEEGNLLALIFHPVGARAGSQVRVELSSKPLYLLSCPVNVPHGDSVFILYAAVQTLIGSEVFCFLERALGLHICDKHAPLCLLKLVMT